MTLVIKLTIIVTFALASLAQNLPAQRQIWSVQGSLFYASPSGESFTGLKDGFGVEGQLRYTPSDWSFGAGYQHSSHDYVNYPSSVILAGPFFEPRYALGFRWFEGIDAYVSGRFSFLRQSWTFGDATGSASGFTLSGGGGLRITLSSRVYCDGGAALGYSTFKQFEVRTDTSRNVFPAGSGTSIVLRLGISLGLGK